jgi:oxygen-independent coproporphyrinogen-3 oxidase
MTEILQSLKALERIGLRRTQTGYYYIAHYFPLRSMNPMHEVRASSLIQALAQSSTELYLHFPFCQVSCSFCHFYKKIAHKNHAILEEAYVNAVLTELEQLLISLGGIQIRSFYIGGGTPSLISNSQLACLLKGVGRYVKDLGEERKFEIYPQNYPVADLDGKLDILKDHGFTDIVIDLESGCQKSLDSVGRSNSSLEIYLRLVDRCVKWGFKSIVTALVIGLPHESEESLLQTLDQIIKIPEITVVNTFPLIIRPPDPVHSYFARCPKDFPSSDERDSLWILARNVLRQAGFCEGPISYLKRPGKRAQQQADKFECVNLVGLGPSAFGYVNGENWAAQYFNVCSLEQYFKRLSRRELPFWRAGILNQEERARRKLIFGLANCKTENLCAIEDRFKVSLNNLLGRELNALLALGLIELDPNEAGIRYTEKGLCRLEEISYFLGSKYVKDSVAVLPPRDDPDWLALLRHHYYIDIPAYDRMLFEEAVDTYRQDFMSHLRCQARSTQPTVTAHA